MSIHCICSVGVISSKGFKMRDGIAYCNSCLKPEVTSSPIQQVNVESPIQQVNVERTGNVITNLFDFKFEDFVSVAYSRLVYGVIVILWTIIAVSGLVLLLMNSSYLPGGTVVLLALGIPIFYFLLIIFTRMSLELIVLFFRIGKDIQALRENS